jgi:peptidoglycan/xylan/chitin deacetylase (PgdA/CDA1 family)
MLARKLKQTVLRLSKYLGLFQLARYLTRRELRILCYHGISVGRESSFRPQLFIDRGVFERRLEYVVRRGFKVLRLEDAISQLKNGTLLNTLVITFDDGFYSTYKHAVPLLKHSGIPATIYVTSYYTQTRNPVFRLLIQYIYWAAIKRSFDLSSLAIEGLRGEAVVTRDEDDRVMWQIIHYGETYCDEPKRRELAEQLARELKVNFQELLQNRYLGLMTAEEIRWASALGIDIQLHTHRHCLPMDEIGTHREIVDNRAVLEPLVGRPLQHLCYPSGLWSKRQWPWLKKLNIKSATVCELGLNNSEASPLAFKRLFDSSAVSSIEFEAELSGYLELARRVRSRFAGVFQRRSAVPADEPNPSDEPSRPRAVELPTKLVG